MMNVTTTIKELCAKQKNIFGKELTHLFLCLISLIFPEDTNSA